MEIPGAAAQPVGLIHFSTMTTMIPSATDASRAATTDNAGAIDGREARFLASQSARLQQAASSGTGRSARRGDDKDDGANDEAEHAAVRTQFWDGFRSCCAALSKELEDIESGAILADREDNGGGADCGNNGDGGSAICEYATASSRAVASSRLDAALASLRLLERHCLSTSSSSSSAPMTPVASSSSPKTVAGETDAANEKDSSNIKLQLNLPATVPDHLPPGDVRLLTTDLGSLQNRLEDLREDICPPELFVFRRYRAAMAARRESHMKESEEGDDANNNAVSSVATGMDGLAVSTNGPSGIKIDWNENEEEHLEQHYGSSIRSQDNCIIEITDSEILSYACSSEKDTMATNSNATSTPLGAADAGSSLLIKDVKRCQISINRQYQSIHIINVIDCTIAAHFAISGPVHVTNCHGTTISAACRQLRIHDCTAVTFRVWVKSGPIIEHCSEMVFRGDPIDVRGNDGGVNDNDDTGGVCHWDEAANMYHDVKDFCWLRTGVPSPNFTVVQCSDSGPEEGRSVDEGASGECAGRGQEVIANTDAGINDEDGDTSSSDEDEL